jgi:hypothetical protein
MLVLVPAASTVLEARATVASAQTDMTLEVIVTGVGDDPADPAIPAVTCVVDGGGACASTGVPAAGEPCKVTDMGDAHGCQYTIGVSQRVTLAPVNAARFVGWSEFDCEGTGACTVTMDSDHTVVATWTPTSLRIAAAFGPSPSDVESITATSSDGKTKIVCASSGPSQCSSDNFAPFDEVTLNAEPAKDFEGWLAINDDVAAPDAPNYYLAACHEDGDSPACTLRLTGNDVVGAKFRDAAEPEKVVPPRKNVTLRVVVEPKAAGTVTSSRSRLSDAISCGSYCSARFQQDEHPRLTADAAAGSRFVRWQGGSPFCVSDTTCRYPALRSTSIKAVFGPAPPPPPPPPPGAPRDLRVTNSTRRTISIAWSPSIDDSRVKAYRVYLADRRVADVTTRQYTLSGLTCGRTYDVAVDAVDGAGNRSQKRSVGAKTKLCALIVNSVRVRVVHHGRDRAVVVGLRVNRSTSARLTLKRKGRTVAGPKTFRMSPGTKVLRLRVRRRVAAGSYRLRIAIVDPDGGPTRVIRRRVRLPKAR